MLLLVVLVFCVTLLLGIIIINALGDKNKGEMDGRLQQVKEMSIHSTMAYDAPRERGDEPGWLRWVRSMGEMIESPYWDRLLEHKLVQGGVPLRSSEFAVVWLAVAALCALLGYLLSFGQVMMAVAGGAIGAMLPPLALNIRIDRRRKKFNEQLADALVLISNSLRTGYSFLQAVDMVSREMPAPLGREFGRVFQEMNLGVPTESALDHLAKRIESTDLDLIITAVLIQRQIGGNLSEILDNIAKTIRSRLKLRGQIKTLTAQGRLSGYIVGGLPFALFGMITMINPGYMDILFTHPSGKYMLGAALFSQFIGMLIIRRIVDIEL